jgi:putative methionine-R-sulfoxide reductase with GAF domain
MIDLFKDRYKLSMLMASLFFIGIVASLYQIYRLPYNLMLANETHPAFVNVYLVLGATFLFGAIALWWTLSNRNEVIIFKEKLADKTNATKDQSDSSKTTISLDSVNEQLKNQTDSLRAGLCAICKQLDAGQGAIYMISGPDGHRKVELKIGYALTIGENTVISYDMGEGLIGQTAVSGKTVYIDDVPEGYVKIVSGLGNSSPRYLLISPLKTGNTVFGVVEIASFTPLTEDQRKFVEEAAQLITQNLPK